ncbi:MAG: hypothetical protein HOW73_25330 [Polyangiaceae bacterium]|nr:hypothetical protein [Polyangiaceae bacterium]
MKRHALVLGLLSSSACSGASPAVDAESVAVPPPGRTVSTSSAVVVSPDAPASLPLFDCVAPACVLSDVSIDLPTPQGLIRLRNGSRQPPIDSVPGIYWEARDKAKALDLATTPGETHTHGWAAAGVTNRHRTIVGVLDNVVESPGGELLVVVSQDVGESWELRATIEKPYYMAEVKKLELESPNRWSIIVALEDCAGCGVKIGNYMAKTEDAGKTFTSFYFVGPHGG